MLFAAFGLLLTLYLPGAALFRLPVLERSRRAALEAGERAYWAVLLSVSWSSIVAFGLAALSRYSIERLLIVNALLVLAVAGGFRSRLRLASAPRPGLGLLVPAMLVALGLSLFYPPAEYVIGGKDPGVYVNAGIQIGQRGSLVTRDPVVAAVPARFRDLFYPSHQNETYYAPRFMGFFILDPSAGTVVPQFPQLYPVWIAIGYGLYGLTGALHVLGACAMLGVLGLYFLGARLLGPTVAGTGAALLAINVVQVWFARYPNAEMLMQALLLGGLLAFARAHIDDIPFFEPVAAVLLGLLLFTRVDAVIAVAAVLATTMLVRAVGVKLEAAFLVPLGAMALAAFAYTVTVLAPYAALPMSFAKNLTGLHTGLIAAGVLLLLAAYPLASVPAVARAVRTWLPRILAAGMVAAAVYAFFLRVPEGRLAPHDANSLRMFTWYLHPAGLAASLIGLVLVTWRRFWRDPAFLLTTCTVATFVFYKIRIVPEHFWMSRRFVVIIMPAALLLAAAAILTGFTAQLLRAAPPTAALALGSRFTRVAIRLALVVLLASNLLASTRAILPHVEYAGVIPRLEELANRFTPRDLLIVESRSASDLHVIALPLAYIYARNVLVLNTPRPDKEMLAAFLEDARTNYDAVYFLGGGGTDLVSPDIGAAPVDNVRFEVPEYESVVDAYPRGARPDKFDFGIYRLSTVAQPTPAFSLDVGAADDLQVVRFHAKERTGERTFRWTRDVSYVSVIGVSPGANELTLVMENGGRPATQDPPRVEVQLGGVGLGEVTVGDEPRPYTFRIPAELAKTAAAAKAPVELRLRSTTWNPRAAVGAGDDRDLGVMVDRIDIR